MQDVLYYDLGQNLTVRITLSMHWPTSPTVSQKELCERLGTIFRGWLKDNPEQASSRSAPSFFVFFTAPENKHYLPQITLHAKIWSIEFLQPKYQKGALVLSSAQAAKLSEVQQHALCYMRKLNAEELLNYLFD